MPYPRPTVTVNNRGAIAGGRVTRAIASAQRRWVQGVLRSVRDTARASAPVDLGAFRRSIIYRTSLTRNGLRVEGEVYSTDTPRAKVAVIEYGRTPGKRMPPKGALLGWMSRHGIPAEREFFVRRKIGRDGIPAKAPFRRAFAKHKGLLATQKRLLAATLFREMSRG